MKIQIKYNRFLDPILLSYFQQRFKLTLIEEQSLEEIDFKVKKYRQEWLEKESMVLNTLESLVGLKFKRNFLDIHIVQKVNRSFSRPIIFDIRKTPSVFIDELSHELIHVLLQENNNIASWETLEWLGKEFKNESKTTQNHIFVHAVLFELYINYLKEPHRLTDNIKRSKKHSNSDYSRAWEIVEEIGSEKLIDSFKSHYRNQLKHCA